MEYETEGSEKEFSPKLSGVLMSISTGLCELLSDDKYDVFCDDQYSLMNGVLRVVHPYFSVSLLRT